MQMHCKTNCNVRGINLSNIMHTDPSIYGFDVAKEFHFSSVLLQSNLSLSMSVLGERGDSMVECRTQYLGMQWLSDRVLNWRLRD